MNRLDKFAPDRFASHFFLTENSEAYRKVSWMDLATENLDCDLLGPEPEKKKKGPTALRGPRQTEISANV